MNNDDANKVVGQKTASGQILTSGTQPYRPGQAYSASQVIMSEPYPPMRPMVSAGPQMQQPPQPGAPSTPISGQHIAALPDANLNKRRNLRKTIAIILLSLSLVTFMGLFGWMFLQYQEANSNLEGKLNIARQEAKDEQKEIDYKAFTEAVNSDYRDFAGPVDYGSLTFKIPKTWSVYIEADGLETNEDFKAYLNPDEVSPLGDPSSIYALEVSIVNRSFDTVVKEYERYLGLEEGGLTIQTIQIGANKNITANLYTGELPNKQEYTGYIVVFKIRDKTAILQTDAMTFWDVFNEAILGTVMFNE